MSSEFNALNAHALHRKTYGVPEGYALTEAEKDQLSRKRERSPPPPTQVEEEDIMDEDSSEEVHLSPGAESQQDARRKLFASSSGVDDEEEAQASEHLNSLLHAVPDLREYFAQFPHMDTKQVISMCRAYASYLATLTKKEPPQKQRKRASTSTPTGR